MTFESRWVNRIPLRPGECRIRNLLKIILDQLGVRNHVHSYKLLNAIIASDQENDRWSTGTPRLSLHRVIMEQDQLS